MIAKLLKLNILGLSLALCFTMLAGCSPQRSLSESSSNSSASNSDTSQPQEMTTEELHKYFQQAFDTKGNALNTPEQVTLELSALKVLTANAVPLPEDYEAQYKEWRLAQVEALLENLQSEYDQIISSASLYDGIHAGVAYADYIDFEGDGVKELLLFSLSPEIDGSEINWSSSIEIYNGVSGHAEAYNNETITCPYLRRSDYDAKGISLVQNQNRTYIHIYNTEGRNIEDTYYGIENNSIVIADETFAAEGSWSLNNQDIPYDEYEAIHAKYTDLVPLASNISIIPVQNHGILPELSSEAQKQLAFMDTLARCNPQYARLADMDGDGTEDLLVVVEVTRKNEYYGTTYQTPIFRAYVWDGNEAKAADLVAEDYNEIGGIYREKSTGKIYANYSGGADLYSWDYFERVSEEIKISDIELSWEEYLSQKNKFELIDDLMYDLPKYDTVDAVRQQLITK